MRFTLYGRADCHLCEVMLGALAPLAVEYDFVVDHVDVDADATLRRRYGARVPVLVDPEGREICHAVLDAHAVKRRIAVE